MNRKPFVLKSVIAVAVAIALILAMVPAALADASTDSTLTALLDSSSLLTPAFSPSVTSYAIALPLSASSVTLTPTAAAGATFTIDGAAEASQAYTLDYGKSVTSTIVVTAEDGVTQTTYTVAVTRAMPGDSKLTSLGYSAGTLTPDFNPNRSFYTLTLPEGTSSVTFTPVAANPKAAVSIQGCGKPASVKTISLCKNEKKMIYIKVVAPNKVAFLYSVLVKRAPSTNDSLGSLSVSGCTLSPAFDPAVTSYTVYVPYNKAGVKIHAAAADKLAKVLIDGHRENNRSFVIATASKKTITVKVIAQSGATQKYTLVLIRAPRILSFSAASRYSCKPVLQSGKSLTFGYTMDKNGGATTLEINVGGTWQTIMARADCAGRKKYVWDGTLNGTPVAQGAYAVRISAAYEGTTSNVKTIAILVK